MTSKVQPLDEATKAVSDVNKAVLARVDTVRGGLSDAQVKIRTSKRFKQIVVAVTFFAALVDFMGTVIVAPMLPGLCVRAPGGPFSEQTLMVNYTCSAAGTAAGTCAAEKTLAYETLMNTTAMKAIVSPYAFYPLSQPMSSSVELPQAISQYMSAIGSLVIGNVVDKAGAKWPMVFCLSMGIIGYVTIFWAGKNNNYWLFAGGLWINSLFGVCTDIASTYMGQLFEDSPTERDTYVGAMGGVVILGASVGAVIVMPFASGNGANVFNAIWVAVGLTALAVLLVIFILVSPPIDLKKLSEAKAAPNTPRVAKKLLIITVLASALDSGGDIGTQMARSSILMNLFPSMGTASVQNILLLAVIGVAIITFIVLALLRKAGLNLAAIATIGAFATLVVQLALALADWKQIPYLILWHSGKLFGMLSTFGSGMMIASVAPTDRLGFWNGLNAAGTNGFVGSAQLLFARVYDAGNDGTPKGKRGMTMLLITSGISVAAFLAYAILIPMWPKSEDDAAAKKKEDDKFESEWETYKSMSDVDYAHLPLKVIDKCTHKMLEKGEEPRMITWGSYAEERSRLTGMADRSLADFEYFKGEMNALLTNRAKMLEVQKMQGAMNKSTADRDAAKAAMGAWIADYFDDAGYQDWEKMCPLYKSMIISAFPPIDPLDDAKPDYANMAIDDFENCLMKFLDVLDQHLTVEKTKLRAKFGLTFLVGILQRR